MLSPHEVLWTFMVVLKSSCCSKWEMNSLNHSYAIYMLDVTQSNILTSDYFLSVVFYFFLFLQYYNFYTMPPIYKRKLQVSKLLR